jgi:hypothetical protein
MSSISTSDPSPAKTFPEPGGIEWENLVKALFEKVFKHIRQWGLDHLEDEYKGRSEILRSALNRFNLMEIYIPESIFKGILPQQPSPPLTPPGGSGAGSFSSELGLALGSGLGSGSMSDGLSAGKMALDKMDLNRLTLVFLNLALFSRWVSLQIAKDIEEFNKTRWASSFVFALSGVQVHGAGTLGELFNFFRDSFYGLYPSGMNLHFYSCAA